MHHSYTCIDVMDNITGYKWSFGSNNAYNDSNKASGIQIFVSAGVRLDSLYNDANVEFILCLMMQM